MKATPSACRIPSTGRVLTGLLSLVALGATLGLAPAVSAQVSADVPLPGPTLPGAVHGDDALSELGAELPALAGELGLSNDELVALLRRDQTLWLTGDRQLVYVDRPAPPPSGDDAPGYSGSIPTSEAFLLHTNPGAEQVIYLDFDGHHSKNNGWGHNIIFPPFNTSGSSASFTTGELQSIIAHWQYVAEDFAPWNVDVTTEEPPIDDILLSVIGDKRFGVRCVLTQPTSGFGNGIGGIAVLGSFGYLQDTPVFVFNKGDNNGSMSASHEVGHSLGLFHDGLNGSEYHPGTGSGATSWGPIMGAPFGATVVHWSKGDYAGATSNQLDASIIGGAVNGMDVWPDDFPDTVATAAPLPLSCPNTSLTSFEGLITRETDVDAWWFETSGGAISISASTYVPGPNLDVQLQLFDGNGVLLQTGNPVNDTNASIATNVAAGVYTILLDGVGKAGVYSDYGSRGAYVLSVSAPVVSSFSSVGSGLAGTGGQVPVLTGTGVACSGNVISTTLDNALGNTTAWLVFGLGQLNAPFKGGTLIPNPNGSVAIPLGGSGSISLPSAWPAGVPSGAAIDFQYWISDAAGPKGFSASNGLELVTP